MNTGKRSSKLTEEQKQSILLEYNFNHTNENIKAICDNYKIPNKSV